jgi:alkanesulfonate monooxygenase SsuD/methylene tetrahydromethanopterin reductase-like flavin-dependent oxidoreductase (luciferase family)
MEAERAGWDGYFVWDHIAWKQGAKHVPVTDPWIVLAAVAIKTERMHLGPMITPLARRRPWKVARETVALDHLSGGRTILGVGLGAVAKTEFRAFGEEDDDTIRGQMLDEALDVITGLWSGQPFSYDGKFYRIVEAHFMPTSMQSPRIPIWVAGSWRGEHTRKPFRRAARFEGTFPFIPKRETTPEDFTAIRDYVLSHRNNKQPFNVICNRPMSTEGIGTSEIVKKFADAGVTWWMVSGAPGKLDLRTLRRLIQSGPPKE